MRRQNFYCIGAALLTVGGAASLVGCGGAGSAEAVPFVGRTYASASVPLKGGTPGTLMLNVRRDASIEGQLQLSMSMSSGTGNSLLQFNYPLTGNLIQADGTFSLRFKNLPYRIEGALPAPPSLQGGNFSVITASETFGPFTFSTKRG